jgi:hypothetical protein
MRLTFTLLCTLVFCAVYGQQNKFTKGEPVQVKFYSVRYQATILEEGQGKYKVHYEDTKRADEWVDASDVLKLETGNTTGGPVRGKYICNFLSQTGWAYSGTFVIRAKGSYEYLTGLKGKGRYKYDEASRRITWSSGDLANKGITGEYVNSKQDGPTITLIFPKGKREGDVQYCICKEQYK